MKKRFMALAMAGVLSMGVLAGCGGDAPAETTTAAATAETPAAETTEAPAEKEAPAAAEVTEAPAEKEAPAEAEEAEAVFVDGYYANDGESDMMLAFFEVGDVDVAYASDGEYEFWSQYTVEEAVTEEGNEYLLVSFTDADAQLGYIDNGDGEYYLVDEDGNIYAAAQLTEDDVEELYAMIQSGEGSEAEAEVAEEADADFVYDSGFYVNDGSSDAMICFFVDSEGTQVAYINDGENEIFDEYEAVETETEDGTPYVLVVIGDTALGYLTDGDDWYIVDEDGNLAAAAELSEDEANAILEALE